MALAFAAAFTAQQREPDGSATTIPHPGNTAIVAAGAASANVALPVDGNGNPYQAVVITATQPAWIAFCTTSGDAVVAATPPAILINGFGVPVVVAVPPAGAGVPAKANAGFLAAIEATASAGVVCITGLY